MCFPYGKEIENDRAFILELHVKNYETVAVVRNGKLHLIITAQKVEKYIESIFLKIQICAPNHGPEQPIEMCNKCYYSTQAAAE